MELKRFLEWAPVKFVAEIVEIYFNKHIARSSAALAYFLILTFFPILICINAFIGLLELDVNTVMIAAGPFLPGDTIGILGEYLSYITENQSTGLLIAGIGVTLFSSSAAFRTLMSTMDEIYDRQSYTGIWQVVASVVFSILLLITIYLSIVVLLTGEWLFGAVGELLHIDFGTLPVNWQWLRFLILFALVLFFVLIVYRMAAPRGKPRPPVLTGAALSTVALVAASILFSWFIGMSSRYSLVYGSLASVIILLVWLYLCGNILIMGNAFNCVWYRRKKVRYLKRLRESDLGGPT